MDLRELRNKISDMVSDSENLRAEVVIECNGKEYNIDDIYISEDGCIIIQAE